MKRVMVIFALCLILPLQGQALDLTGAGITSGFVNGALFSETWLQSAGTGVIDPFLRIQSNTAPEQGFNTTGTTYFDEKPGTTALLLSDIPSLEIGGVYYREFLLDINQQGSDSLLSLDEVQIFRATSSSLTTSNPPGTGILDIAATLLWRLDGTQTARTDNNVLMNYDQPGSGVADIYMYVPETYFTGNGDYIYLYALLGATNLYGNNDGIEEWAIRDLPPGTPVPEPATMLLFGVGLLGLAGYGRKKLS